MATFFPVFPIAFLLISIDASMPRPGARSWSLQNAFTTSGSCSFTLYFAEQAVVLYGSKSPSPPRRRRPASPTICQAMKEKMGSVDNVNV